MITSPAAVRPWASDTRAGTRRLMRDESGVRFAIGHAALVGAVLVAAVLRLDPSAALTVLAATVLVAGVGLGAGWTAGLAVSAWALYTGFLEHSEGTLTLAGRDLDHLAVLVGVGLLAALVGGRARE